MGLAGKQDLMKKPLVCLPALVLSCFSFLVHPAHSADSGVPEHFTRLEPLPPPKIVASAQAYAGGRHNARNILAGKPGAEYASASRGTNTFIEFDFGAPTSVTAFRHVDRNDPATIAASELTFLDASGTVVSKVPVKHVNQRAGVTSLLLPKPVTAQRVRWQVTRVGAGFTTVGGAHIAFYTAGKTESAPLGTTLEARAEQMLERQGEALVQPLKVTVHYPYAEPVLGKLRIAGASAEPMNLQLGSQTIEVRVPAVTSEKAVKLEVEAVGQTVASQQVTLKPVRQMEIFILPHSHNDIGYTALQADVVKKQDSNIETGLRLAKATADYPQGSRFVWNVEVLWCVDNYLRSATPEQRAAFMAAVKSGQIGLDAFYCNILTGLCRPEELLELMRYATELSAQAGVPIESAMISDVPGYTWGTVSAMAQAGVKYFSFAPNYFDRMGGTMKEWQNKPFWWKGPDGKSRVLCWCPSRGYALGHLIGDGEALARFIPEYLTELETNSYPYDISHLRWNVHGDNGSPDEKVADVVRDWNARHVWPRLTISTTAAAFRAFQRRYGDKLPEYTGDYTPYWEDGAASSAFETAINRASAERLVQAETLWAIRNPGPFPASAFQDAWRNILLYSEHTWGAHNSISQPDLPFVRDQWKVKQAFALDADNQSHALLAQALGGARLSSGAAPTKPGGPLGSAAPEDRRAPGAPVDLDVFNTSSWKRTGLVTLSAKESSAGDRVTDEKGKPVPSQRLSTGELVFLAQDVPPYAAKRFRVEAGTPPARGKVSAEGTTLFHPDLTVKIDEHTGGIVSLYSRKLHRELVDAKAATALNDYFYLPGSDVKGLQRSGPARITVKENGPLVAALLIESDAPGCKRLAREVRVVDGLDQLELINTVDKLPIRTKEGLHFGFGFDVPEGMPRFDVGWAAVRPELDQIPASCKNWFSVQRWVDISNEKFGVTWCPVDAPLVELGGITANLIGSQTDPSVWIQHLSPSQTIYSWVMNNHWHTNYRADQEGPTAFRFVIRPHKRFAPEEAARFGAACSQPLIAVPAWSPLPGKPRLTLSSDKVVVTALKPSDDGKGWIVRLFGASGKTEKVKLAWADPAPKQLWLSNTSEKPLQQVGPSVEVPGWGIVALRAE
jgi:alpha-mannosidase